MDICCSVVASAVVVVVVVVVAILPFTACGAGTVVDVGGAVVIASADVSPITIDVFEPASASWP